METFDFYLDTKITTWMRTEFQIEAKSLKEAKKKAIEFHKKGETESISWDYNPEFNENMSVIDNGGEPTEELFCYDDSNKIWDNGQTN